MLLLYFFLFYLWVVGERLNGRTVNGRTVVQLNGFCTFWMGQLLVPLYDTIALISILLCLFMKKTKIYLALYEIFISRGVLAPSSAKYKVLRRVLTPSSSKYKVPQFRYVSWQGNCSALFMVHFYSIGWQNTGCLLLDNGMSCLL